MIDVTSRLDEVKAKTAEALRAVESDPGVSVVLAAVVREFDSKADKANRIGDGNGAARDSVIELEQAGDSAKADALSERIFTIMEENLTWMLSLEPRFAAPLEQEMAISHAVMGRLESVASDELKAKLGERMSAMDELMQGRQTMSRRTTRMRF